MFVLFVLQELQATDSNDVFGLNRKRRSSNKLVIVSDDEGDGEHNDKDVCSKAGECNGDSFSTDHQHTGLSCVFSSSECQVVWREVAQKDCQARNMHREDAMDRSRWKKLIKIG